MKNYYLKTGTKVTGPFMLDDLKYQRISSDTLVCIDQGEWKKITSVSDLKSVIDFAGVNAKPTSTGHASSNKINDKVNQAPVPAQRKQIAVVIALAVLLLGLGMALLLFSELK